jgi:hypothetical protein
MDQQGLEVDIQLYRIILGPLLHLLILLYAFIIKDDLIRLWDDCHDYDLLLSLDFAGNFEGGIQLLLFSEGIVVEDRHRLEIYEAFDAEVILLD